MTKIENYISGNKVSFSKKTLTVMDPSTGEKKSEVVMSGKEDFELAVNSSSSAFENCFWAKKKSILLKASKASE